MKRLGLFLCALLLTGASLLADELAENFLNPPDSAKPQTWWHWMNGNITKQGITADLEAMKRVGIGGAQIFNVNCGIPEGPVKIGSEEWVQLKRFAIAEASRLGLEIGIHNCAGWSSSGGPWNTPENAMQYVVGSEVAVRGPKHESLLLPQPAKRLKYYRDIAVLAFKRPQGETVRFRDFAPKISTSDPSLNASVAIDGDLETSCSLPLGKPGQPAFVQFEFDRPFAAQTLSVAGELECAANIQISDDGKVFKTIRSTPTLRGISRLELSNSNSFTFPLVSSRFFRVELVRPSARMKSFLFNEIEWSPRLGVENLEAKAAYFRVDNIEPAAEGYSPEHVLPRGEVIDLTSRMEGDGRLEWDVPEGGWTILRLGHTPTGKTNQPAPGYVSGLECDKLSKEALDAHWADMMQKVVDAAGPLAGKSLNNVIIDSYEASCQNWTPRFREEFKKRRAYDLFDFLPVLGGRVVESPEVTERFLWDMRRTIADLFAENYYGHMAALAHRNGMHFSVEPYGDGPFEDLAAGATGDIVMAEFWAGMQQPHHSCKLAASVAHTNGLKIIGAESFTASYATGKWQNHPYLLKATGDRAYCMGINRFIMHRFAHQPWLNVYPGMTMGPWGCHFDRTNTWWEQGSAWLKYLARCQYLLQQGLFVADVCVFTGEDAPSSLDPSVKMPPGHDFDGCGTNVIMKMEVKKGRIVLPEGMSYRLLMLPESRRMTPQLINKVAELVRDGATVIAPKPSKSPSLSGYPACDTEVARLADEVWCDCDGKQITEHAYGKGKVIWGKPLGKVLAESKIAPDFEGDLSYIHRTVGEAEIYFLSNQKASAREIVCTFRVAGKAPELWSPDTGLIEQTPLYDSTGDGRTKVVLRFDPAGSVFVVFRKPVQDPVVAVTRNGQPLGASESAQKLTLLPDGKLTLTAWEPGAYMAKTDSGKVYQANVPALPQSVEIDGPWELRFPPNWGAPERVRMEKLVSWPEHSEEGVKHFSGTATYETKFNVPADSLGQNQRLYLDLGRVEVIAQVAINGKDLGILWKPPFRVDVTDSLNAGENLLEVKITNLWPNRLIGDAQLPEDAQWKESKEGSRLVAVPQWLKEGKASPAGRLTFATWKHWDKEDALLPSGLLGPVKLVPAAQVPLSAK